MMKKIFSILLVLFMLLTASAALAEDIGIQIIGGPEAEQETVCLDDFKVGDTAVIDGYGEIGFVNARWTDFINGQGQNSYNAQKGAIYLQLQFDILNTHRGQYNYYDDFSEIICTYDSDYQFGGWLREHVNNSEDVLLWEEEGSPVDMMYRGKYSVVVTLPMDVYTRVTEEGKPLTVSFKLGENEFTYIWRKN